MLGAADFFDLTGFEHAELFSGCQYVWQAFQRLADYLAGRTRRDLAGEVAAAATVDGDVLLARGAVIEAGAMVQGPAVIEAGCRVGHGALLRGGVILGAGAVVGHASEVKASVLLPGAQAPHFNYVGDSMLGRGVNLGAGAICSNLKLSGTPVVVNVGGDDYDTGLRKLGAIIGDGAQIGCNCVLNPGTLLGKNVLTYPGVSLRGYVPPDTIVKLSQGLSRTDRW